MFLVTTAAVFTRGEVNEYSLSLFHSRLTEHLGSGQFGTVNKGIWQSPSGPVTVAVKQLQLKAIELDRVRFLQEAAIMGQFYHPNVVTLHGVVTKDDPVSWPHPHQIASTYNYYLLSRRL